MANSNGGTINFSAVGDTGRISNASTSSNTIGGVVLSNGNISNASTTSNNIGGVQLSNGAISNSATSSNTIGGAVLSNRVLTMYNSGGYRSTVVTTANDQGFITLGRAVG